MGIFGVVHCLFHFMIEQCSAKAKLLVCFARGWLTCLPLPLNTDTNKNPSRSYSNNIWWAHYLSTECTKCEESSCIYALCKSKTFPLHAKLFAFSLKPDLELCLFQCYVQFIDYGNGEPKQNTDIVELPGGLSSKEPFAKKYILYGLKPIHDKDSQGYLQVRC